MAELVDALDSKSSIFGCAGSIPARGTKKPDNYNYQVFSFIKGALIFLLPRTEFNKPFFYLKL
jgi:hypothetical protein